MIVYIVNSIAPCVAAYGQCGGLEYTGETACCEGSTCQYTNIWYSQCILGTPPANIGRHWVSHRVIIIHFM